MMDRRTFLLLTGATSGAIWGPSFAAAAPPARAGRLRVTLDDDRRWSLWYQGGGAPVAVIQDAALGAWIGDRFVSLGDLEDTAIGNRRPPAGESLVVRGRAAGVVIEAEFVTGDLGPAPYASITVSVYPDRQLPACRGVRYFDAPASRVLPAPGALLALVNGYESRSDARVTRLPLASGELTSHAALGLTRGAQGLGIAFDPGEPGEGAVRLTPDGLAATTEWLPPRPLRPQGEAATLRLAYHLDADGLIALTTLFAPASPVDRERLAALTVPAGWTTRRGGAEASEAAVLANLEICAAHFDPRYLRVVLLDDGYQRAAGDWDTNERFGRGHRWLTDQIHARGLAAGLWIAPFAAAEASGLPARRPDWLLKDAAGPVVFATRDDWGGRVYGLDGAHPGVQEWLYDLARRVSGSWGYDHLVVDFLQWATGGVSHHGGLTHAEAYRRGLAAIRDGLGPDPFLLGAGAPWQHAQGLMTGMRIGPDVSATWAGVRAAANAAALRSFYHRGAWFNHPGHLLVGSPLSAAEARVWASVVAVAGGVTFLADDLRELPPERMALLRRTLPVTPAAGRPVDVWTGAAGQAAPPAASDGARSDGLVGGRGDGSAAIWVAEGGPRWWTVVLVNWGDDPREFAVALRDLGIAGPRLTAYDVWSDAPLPDVREHLTATVEPHGVLVVALRPAAGRPHVIGTTRHVVQGALDLADERWNATTRTLSARSTALDGRAYRVTIAVPATLRPAACRADVECAMQRLDSGHVVLEWPEGGDGRDITWEVRFRAVRRGQGDLGRV